MTLSQMNDKYSGIRGIFSTSESGLVNDRTQSVAFQGANTMTLCVLESVHRTKDFGLWY